MKRFLKIATLLIISLFVLVSGVDVTLDHLTRSASQNTYTLYDEKGDVVLLYKGNLAYCPSFAKPSPVPARTFLHRIRMGAASLLSPVSS